ncbi:MAG: alpha/beta hydrolase [Thalassobaculaceae bacterium]|nr:alpha/beta hydrolase [Thalassobaculaceae bacterium]
MTDQGRVMEFEGRRIVYDIIDIAAPWRASQKQTILFHHGVAMDRQMWRDWLPALVGTYRVVVFDMFGCGESEAAGPAKDWTPAARVRDILALADAVGAERFHLVGESYGGTVSLLTALTAPERLLTLTAVTTAHIGSSIESVAWWKQLIDDEGMKGWAARMMPHRFHPDGISAPMADWYLNRQATTTGESVVSILRELQNLDLAERVGEIETPVLLLHGDSSPFVPASLVADLHGRLPNSRLKIFPHAKHGLPFSHGRDCGEALCAFLSDWRASA